jgi:hypothetical protein
VSVDFEEWLQELHTRRARKALDASISGARAKVDRAARTGDLPAVRATIAVFDALKALKEELFNEAK